MIKLMVIPWTAKKQIIYFFIFLLIVSVIIFFIWLGVTKPTCFDNKQNQGEEGIDCGGPCQKRCLGDIKELIVLWSKFFEISKGKYDVAALVKNPNLFLGTPSLKYKFKIYGKNNVLIAEREGETFITPGETYLIFETNISTGLQIPAKAFIELEQSPQWEWVEKERLPLVVSKKQFFNNLPFPRLIITLENKTISAVNDIDVATVLYDRNKNAKGVSSTMVDSIAGESFQEVVFTWPQLFSEEPSSIEIFFRTGL